MIIEVLNTGTELLLGQVVNSHLAWLGQQLFPLGLRVARQTAIPDGAAIRRSLSEAFDRCDVLLVTGGLGPTTDDVTREMTAEILGLPLREDATVLAAIHARLAKRGFVFRERMARQAMVPEGAQVLTNPHGTAPGLYLSATSTPSSATPHIFLLPGPPRELRPMFETHVAPILRSLADPTERSARTFHVIGMGESAVEEKIGLALVERGDVEVGYCARPNEVDFRLIGARSTLDAVESQVLAALGDCLVSRDGQSLEHVVVDLLESRHATLALAESCTGGLLAHRITNIPGASDVFLGSFVTYANTLKSSALAVSSDLLAERGAVSAPVACAMAEGARLATGSDYALALTGIAGPGGATPTKPVGTVFVALAAPDQPTTWSEHCFPTDRATFKDLATQQALNTLRLRLLTCVP